MGTGQYENDYEMKMISMMRGKKTIVDIGANLGFYTVIAGKLYPTSRVYSFEPIPQTFAILEDNIRLNGVTNSVAENIALSDEHQKNVRGGLMYYTPEASGAASFANIQEREGIKLVEVNMATLDDYFRGERVDFVKCDVEGSEFHVFKGAEKTLRKHRPVIFVEILRKWCLKFGHTASDVVDFLKSCGYKMYVVRETNLTSLDSITDDTADTNFVFC